MFALCWLAYKLAVLSYHITSLPKMTEGQYSPVRLKLAGLVSSLLYGTRVDHACLFSVKTHFQSLEFKGLPQGVVDDASNSK